VPSRSLRCCGFERVLTVPPVDCGSSLASSPSSWHVPVPGPSGGGASLRCRGIRAGEAGRRLPLGPHLTFRRPQYRLGSRQTCMTAALRRRHPRPPRTRWIVTT
jgi:hypothetical protein